MYWLLVGLVRSLKSSHKEAPRKLLLCEDDNNLTSPTSNQLPDIHIAVFVAYDTLKNSFFEHLCSRCLILHFNRETTFVFAFDIHRFINITDNDGIYYIGDKSLEYSH